MILSIRPITGWPGELRNNSQRIRSAFNSSYSDTLELLDRELRMLRATVTVVQIAVNEGQVRRDGKLRASAYPDHPGVILSFDTKAGHFRYAGDRFTHWHDNLRAIALTLESLRKIERYGIGSGTEQYTGYLQLEATSRPMTVDEARDFITEHGGTYRIAARKLHPDAPRTGDEALFKRLGVARAVLALSED
jgi:hypothetical protein